MKRQIRRGVFETNSSSTHSLTICTEEEFNKWKNGELLFDKWHAELVKKVNLTKEQKADAEEEYMDKKDVFQKDWSELSDVAKDQYYKSMHTSTTLLEKDCKHIPNGRMIIN